MDFAYKAEMLRRLTGVFFWIGVFLLSVKGDSSLRADEFDYRPACQWIRLYGEVPVPDFASDDSLLLTVTYRLSGQKIPATLLTNYPLHRKAFKFVLAGFDERIDHAILVPPQFFFSKTIEFAYQARTADGRWSSGWRKSYFHPERIKKGGQVLCQTAIRLGFEDGENK